MINLKLIPMFFTFIPIYDEIMDTMYKWAYPTLDAARLKFSDNVLYLFTEQQANRKNLIKALNLPIPLNFIAAHGKPDRIVIRKYDITLLHMDELTENMCKDKIFYFISCELGKEFGKRVAELGGGFLGYVDEIAFTFHESFARVLIEPLVALIHKKSLREAYEITIKAYNEEIERLKNKADPLSVHTRILLEYNRDHLVYYGNPDMRLQYLDLTLAKLAFVTHMILQVYLPFVRTRRPRIVSV